MIYKLSIHILMVGGIIREKCRVVRLPKTTRVSRRRFIFSWRTFAKLCRQISHINLWQTTILPPNDRFERVATTQSSSPSGVFVHKKLFAKIFIMLLLLYVTAWEACPNNKGRRNDRMYLYMNVAPSRDIFVPNISESIFMDRILCAEHAFNFPFVP